MTAVVVRTSLVSTTRDNSRAPPSAAAGANSYYLSPSSYAAQTRRRRSDLFDTLLRYGAADFELLVVELVVDCAAVKSPWRVCRCSYIKNRHPVTRQDTVQCDQSPNVGVSGVSLVGTPPGDLRGSGVSMGTPAARHCCSSAISPRSAERRHRGILPLQGTEPLRLQSCYVSQPWPLQRAQHGSWCSTTKENGTSKMPAAASTATMSARKPSIAHHY